MFKHQRLGCTVTQQFSCLRRAVYSNPPVHGARIAAEVVGTPALFEEWNQEMQMMAGRIKVPICAFGVFLLYLPAG